LAVAVGVAISDDPDPIPSVRRTNGGSGDTVPLRIIPERADILKDQGKPFRAKGRYIFRNDPPRANSSDDSGHFRPETRTLTHDPNTAPCAADVLTWEASAHQVGVSGVGLVGSDVVMLWYVGPVLMEHLAGFVVLLDELDCLEGAGSL